MVRGMGLLTARHKESERSSKQRYNPHLHEILPSMTLIFLPPSIAIKAGQPFDAPHRE
jgi:hypothetical protein